MKYIILCGGRGERFPNGSPKPLNKVCGRMIGEWMIESILNYKEIKELYWVINPKLYEYNIEDEVKKWTKNTSDVINSNYQSLEIKNIFIKLPFETMDPCQTLELAISQFDFDEDFICLDNDNIYIDGLDKFYNLTMKQNIEAAILVSMMTDTIRYEPRYGFVKVQDEYIIDGKEKVMNWGENAFSYGAYWFSSVNICKKWLLQLRTSDNHSRTKERSLLNLIIKYSNKTKAITTNETFSIGTPQDCADAEINKKRYFGWNKIKIIINTNNNLITGNLTTGLQNVNNDQIIKWIEDKKSKGAKVIYLKSSNKPKNNNTTHSKLNNKIKDKTLYIDDQTINIFDANWIISSGDLQMTAIQNPMNLLPITRNVSIKIKHVEHIIKSGPYNELKGQAHYYEYLNNNESAHSIKYLFPQCYNIDISSIDNECILDLEYIKGVPGSYLWCYNVWGEREWDLCMKSLKLIHLLKIENNNIINEDDIINGYIEKCENRRKNFEIFEQIDPNALLWNILKEKISSYKPNDICRIHGDSFLGNIIFPMTGGIKFIDMRGEFGDLLTIYGDRNYDYAKLATSFLGIDEIVYNLPIRSIQDGLEWINKLDNSEIIILLALILMYGIICFYEPIISAKIINRINEILLLIS